MEVIKNLDHNQHRIIKNIIDLHLSGKPIECDMTYSKGAFYGTFKVKDKDVTTEITIEQPRLKFDVFPLSDDVQKIEPLQPLPLEDNSIDSLMIDLPFVVYAPDPDMTKIKESSSIIFKRFNGFYPVSELYKAYYFWIREAYRVLRENGVLIFKTQNTISGGINHNTEFFSFMVAERLGFVTEDTFVLGAKSRIISAKVKKQQHARKFTSTFFVFKKPKSKRYEKFNYWKVVLENEKFFNDRENQNQ